MTKEEKPIVVSIPIDGVEELMDALGIQHPYYFQEQSRDDWKVALEELHARRLELLKDLAILQARIRRMDLAIEAAQQTVDSGKVDQ